MQTTQEKKPFSPPLKDVLLTRWAGKRSKMAIRDHNLRLDPAKDYEEISFLVTYFDSPFDTQRSLEYALLRTFAVPRTSEIMVKSREMVAHPQKRYDDTVLLLAEIVENGLNSERGLAAIRRMNQIHHHFPITNEEFLYVLTTFVFEPLRWNERFGWRETTRNEKLAAFYYWQELGKRMGIKNIPDTYEELERYNIEYERTHFRYAEANHKLAVATRDLFLGWLPRPLRPIARQYIYAFMDDPMREAFGFPKPHKFFYKSLKVVTKIRSKIMRWLPPRRQPKLLTGPGNRTYPQGYTIPELGPDHLRK
jgi:hypothetical protein